MREDLTVDDPDHAPNHTSPPKVRCVLTVGITGHRRLDADAIAPLTRSIETLLKDIAGYANTVQAKNADVFDDVKPRLSLLSGLAVGADQIAADVALAQGWRLNAILPMAMAEYVKDFDDETVTRLHDLMHRATHTWATPEPVGPRDHAYALAGQVTAAQSDLMIAVWDGDDARGPGGTADVVDYATRRGVPVIWLWHPTPTRRWRPASGSW